MAVLNIKNITQAVTTLITDNVTNTYIIERNPSRNDDSSRAARNGGWIGIYRGPVSYEPQTATTLNPWLATVQILVEIQFASSRDGTDAEDGLEDGVNDVLTALETDRKLGSTVDYVRGYSIEYEYNPDRKNVWFHSATITITAEVRA